MNTSEKEKVVRADIPRREADRSKCAFHDQLFNGMNLDSYMTKWAFAIIIGLFSTFIGLLVTIGLITLQGIRVDQKTYAAEMRLEQRTLAASLKSEQRAQTQSLIMLTSTISGFGVKQEGVLRFIEKIMPEHEELMDHMKRGRGDPLTNGN